ncbi:MAG TPA: MFS transporter [Thermoanaerobaculia bacterium]|nr:MFS transporter [Thermoanaerobaculia bacterium]
MSDAARRIAALSPEQRERLLQELARARREDPSPIAPAPEKAPAATETALPPLVPNPSERWEPFPLTTVQQIYWAGRSRFFDLWTPGVNVYIEYELTGNHEGIADTLEAALEKVIAHHEILRFKIWPDGCGQLLERVPRFYVDVVNLGRLDPAEVERRLEAVRERFRYHEGPADYWPLFGILLHLLDDGRSRAHLWFDCLLVDGLSRDNFWRDLFKVAREPDTSLPPLSITYRDYAVAWEEIRAGRVYQEARERWQQRIAALPPPLDLPLAEAVSPLTRNRYSETFVQILSSDAWQRLKERAGWLGVTPSSLLLAAFVEVLRAWSARPQFFFSLEGSHWPPIHPQIREIVGNFNTIYIVTADDLAGTFAERVKRLHTQISRILEDRVFSGFEVLREIRRKLGGGTRALSPVMFNSLIEFRHASYQSSQPNELSGSPAPVGPSDDDALRIRTIEESAYLPQLLLLSAMIEAGDGSLLCKQMSNEHVFAPGVPGDLRNALATLLERLAADAEAWKAPHFSLAPASHLASRSARTAPVAAETNLYALFSTQVQRRPGATAVDWAGGGMTYCELAGRAHHLAQRLRELGAGPNQAVAVVLDGGWQQVTAVLGTLGAAAACLPLEGTLPPAQWAETLRRHGVRLAVGSAEAGVRLEGLEGIRWLAIEEAPPEASPDGSFLTPVAGPGDLAYMANGAEVEHRAAATAFLDLNLRLDLTPEDRVLGLSPPGCDFALYEMLGPLTAGATVLLPSGGGASVWSGPPALLERALARCEAGELPPPRLVLASRDTVPLSLPNRLRAAAPGLRVLACAGLPETPAAFALHEVDRVPAGALRIPAGQPVAGFMLHVLDHALEPRPDWVPGELYIGGPALARGSSPRFLVHPRTGERLLRTGLTARFLPEGILEVLGREGEWTADRFGYPVELRRIEAALEHHPAVRTAVARDRAGRGLHAWVVPAPGTTVEATDLAVHLASRVPPYMIPMSLEILAEMPLDRAGTVDREALLPKPEDPLPASPTSPVPPGDPLEEELARDWCEILEVDSVSVTDNFFEVGGDSFRAVLLLNRLRERFEQPGDLVTFFYDPTIRHLAGMLRGKERAAPVAVWASVLHRLAGLLRRPGSRPLSPTGRVQGSDRHESSNVLLEMREFLILWIGQFVSMIGTNLGGFSLGVWVFEKTGSATQFALIAVLAGTVIVVISPLAGALADRWDRRKIMFVSNVGSAVMTVGLASLMLTGRLEIWHVYPFIIVMVGLGALQGPALTASISLLVPRRHLARAAGMSQVSRATAQIIAPFAAGLLVAAIGYYGVIYIDCATFLFAAATLLLVRIPHPPRATEPSGAAGSRRRSMFADLAQGWAYIRERPGLFALLSMYALTNFCLGTVQVLLTPLILSFATPVELGSVNSAAAAGVLLGSLTLSLWGGPRNRIWTIFAVLLFQGCLLFLGGVEPSIPLIALAAFGFMFTTPIIAGSNQAILQSKVAPEVQGRVFGMAAFIVACTIPLASALAGPLVDRVFQPMLSPGGALADTFVGNLIGVGPGRGAGLLFVVVGVVVLVIVSLAFLNPRLRRVETELPDAVTPDRRPQVTSGP